MTTKFDIEQKVFLLHNNDVHQLTVNRIVINQHKFARYEFSEIASISRDENQVFATKDELLKSL